MDDWRIRLKLEEETCGSFGLKNLIKGSNCLFFGHQKAGSGSASRFTELRSYENMSRTYATEEFVGDNESSVKDLF